MQNGITWQWQPSWKFAAIFKWSKHLNSFCNIDCTFCMLKTLHLFPNWPFPTICCHVMAKLVFRDSPCWPSWQMAAILKYYVSRVICPKSDPYTIFVPNLVLVSYFERFLHWSAPLYLFLRLVWLFCIKYTLMYLTRKYRILEYWFCVECDKFVVGLTGTDPRPANGSGFPGAKLHSCIFQSHYHWITDSHTPTLILVTQPVDKRLLW